VLHVEADHVRNVHGIEVTPHFLERARGRIQEVEDAASGTTAAETRRRAAGR
jgi:hypothetical protein